ncbi:hypothetical protein C8R43DRAFT_1104212 [Mycena crocata]|nr:hypothetical protein C8R43DRAFT_1104212 [Mycena crocata]
MSGVPRAGICVRANQLGRRWRRVAPPWIFPLSFGIPPSKTAFHLCQPGITWKFVSVFGIPEAGITSCTTSFSNPYRYLAVITYAPLAKFYSIYGVPPSKLKHQRVSAARICRLQNCFYSINLEDSPARASPRCLRAAAPNRVPATGVTISLFRVPASGVTCSRGFKNCANALPTLFLKNSTHWNLQMHADREYFKYFAFNYVFTHAPS